MTVPIVPPAPSLPTRTRDDGETTSTESSTEDVLTSARCTDVGNARRFIAQHGTKVRYCHTWRKWLEWDGTRWAIDETGAITRRAKATLDALFHARAGPPFPAAPCSDSSPVP
ncbi:MAG: hypothetical protein IID44_29385 [Planctomycetes bacterium]|nr:hypothetical protein [Planctomycetota bacterium]